MGNKIVVTGGTGFIGSHTAVELIQAGITPIIIDNFSNSEKFILDRLEKITGQKIIFYETDCRDKEKMTEIFKQEKPNAVMHFAAFKAVGESIEQPLKYYNNNVGSLIILLEVMKEQNINELVFSSSCTVYGEPKEIPVNENTPLQKATSPYGNTKIICEQLLIEAMKSRPELKIVSLRYFNPIGAHSSGLIGELPNGIPNNLVPFITQTAAGWREQLKVNGGDYATHDGTCIRDYIHVVDLAKAHVSGWQWMHAQKSLSSPEIFNLGTGKGSSVLDAIKAFETANDIKINYSIGPRREGDVVQIFASVNKALDVLNWQTNLSLTDAMRDAWRWQQTLVEKK